MEPNPIRSAELDAAKNNPNIISTLAGQSSPVPATPPPGLTASSMQSTASDLSNKLYGSGFVSGGEAQKEAMMQELFNYDQSLERGQSPYPQTPWYTQNPADAYATGAAYAGQAGQNINKVIGAVDTTERAYQSAITGVMSQMIDYLKLQEERKQEEERQKFEREKFEYQKKKDAEENGSISSLASILGMPSNPGLSSTPSTTETNPMIAKLGEGPTYSPGKAGIVENIGGKTYTSDDKGNWIISSLAGDSTTPATTDDKYLKYKQAKDLLMQQYMSETNAKRQTQIKNQIDVIDSYLKSAPETVNTSDPIVKAYADKIQKGELSFSNIPTDRKDAVVLELSNRPMTTAEKKSYEFISKGLDTLSKLMTKNRFAGIIPLSVDKAAIDQTRKLVGMEIARLFEKGRMSDEDRAFYLSMLPDGVTAAANPDVARQSIETLKVLMGEKYPQNESPSTTTSTQSRPPISSFGR